MTPGVQETLDASRTYGISTVLVVILVLFFLAAFSMVLRWVFKTTDGMRKESHDREIALSVLLSNGIINVTEALQENTTVCHQITQSLRDGFEGVKKADEYHRADIAIISKKIDDNECRAT